MSTVLRLRELEVGYQGRAFLPPLRFSIERGQQWALLGPNGAGKTTLLRTILGLLPPIGGQVELGPQTRIGYVPQRASLSTEAPARVIDVVRGGLDHGWSFLDPRFLFARGGDVDRAMQDANVTELAAHSYNTLSEGQKQRVLVARSLAANAQLLVLDEPTAAMDVTAERDVFELLARLRDEREIAVMIVSHQLSVAARYATHAVIVDKDRRFAACGTMAEIAHAADTRARYGDLLVEALEAS